MKKQRRTKNEGESVILVQRLLAKLMRLSTNVNWIGFKVFEQPSLSN